MELNVKKKMIMLKIFNIPSSQWRLTLLWRRLIQETIHISLVRIVTTFFYGREGNELGEWFPATSKACTLGWLPGRMVVT